MKLSIHDSDDCATATDAFMDVCNEAATGDGERPTHAFWVQVPSALHQAEECLRLLPADWPEAHRDSASREEALFEALAALGVILTVHGSAGRLSPYQRDVVTEALQQFKVRTILKRSAA